MQHPTKFKTENSAFTVIELLVATAVTAILAGLMITMISGVLSAWNRTSGSLNTNNGAKLVFDLLGEDLQGAFHKNDGSVWLAVDVLHDAGGPINYNEAYLKANHGWVTTDDPSTDEIKPTVKTGVIEPLDLETVKLEDARYGLGGAWLRFFTSANGHVSAVSYQIVRRHILDFPTGTPNPSEIRYMLMRSTSSPLAIDPAKVIPPLKPYDLGVSPMALIYSDPNTQLVNPSTSSVIANNVIDFGVRFYVRDFTTGNLELIFPANTASPPALDDNHRQYLAGGLGPNALPYPEVADVFVRVLTDEGAQLIENLEAGRITGDWWEIAEANSRVYTQRIRIGTRSD